MAANRYAIATGNWSNPAIWDGGTLPASDDTVRPNSYTVTIDQDVTAALLTNVASAPAVGGGSFVVNTNGRLVTANVLNGSAACITSNFAGTWTLIGNVTAGSTACITVANASSGFTLIGNVLGSTANGTSGITAITINVVGNVTGGSLNGKGINATTVNLTGNATGGSAFSVVDAVGVNCQNLTMTGIATGGSAGMAPGIYVTGAATGNITANGGGIYYGVTGTGSNIIIKSAVFTTTGSLPFSPNVRFDNSGINVSVVVASGSTEILGLSVDSTLDPSDVLEGVQYDNGTKTGTLKILDPVTTGIEIRDQILPSILAAITPPTP